MNNKYAINPYKLLSALKKIKDVEESCCECPRTTELLNILIDEIETHALRH